MFLLFFKKKGLTNGLNYEVKIKKSKFKFIHLSLSFVQFCILLVNRVSYVVATTTTTTADVALN